VTLEELSTHVRWTSRSTRDSSHSKAAPPMTKLPVLPVLSVVEERASTRRSVSTTSPLPTLMKIALSFIASSSFLPISLIVEGVEGRQLTTTSDCSRRSRRELFVTDGVVERVKYFVGIEPDGSPVPGRIYPFSGSGFPDLVVA
jgi:hypothetical protein